MASQTSEIDGKYIAGQMQSVRDRTVSTRTHNTWSIFSSCIIIVGGQNNRQRCVEDSGEVGKSQDNRLQHETRCLF